MKNLSPLFLAAFLLSFVGVWGCNQQKSGNINAKINELENRYTKLEDDYRTLQTTNEQHRKRLSYLESQRNSLESERSALCKQLASAESERETLRKRATTCSNERDVAQANLIQFNKDLQSLVSRVETAISNNSTAVATTVIPTSKRSE